MAKNETWREPRPTFHTTWVLNLEEADERVVRDAAKLAGISHNGAIRFLLALADAMARGDFDGRFILQQ